MTKASFAARYGWLIRQELRAMRDWGADAEETIQEDFEGVFEKVREWACDAALGPNGDGDPDERSVRRCVFETLKELRAHLQK